jgi:CRP/FNR family cyclic AMP-dependent transcriptional regulator
VTANEGFSSERAASEGRTLGRFALFKGLDSEDVRRLERRCVWRRFEPGSQILSQDDYSTDVYFVGNGLVRLWLPTFRRTDVLLAVVGAGEFFGELAAIDGQRPRASVTALTATTVACMPAAVFCSALSKHAEMCNRVLRLLATRVRELDARVWELSTLSVRERIRAELLRLGRPRPNEPNCAVISPPPTHIELAARISGHREAVTRELSILERDGLLQRRRGALVLCNVAALADLLEKSRAVDRETRAELAVRAPARS